MITRIKKIIEYAALSDRAFAIKCGINQPTLFNQLKGLRNVSLDTVKSILATFPEISGDWLITGSGNMMKSNTITDINRIATLVDTIATLQDTINEKNKTIHLLTEQINKLKAQIR